MKLEKFKQACDLASKVSAVLLAPSIALSTAATVILLPLTVLLSICAGNFREKFSFIVRNPIAWVLLGFYAMFLIGILYSTAPCSSILLMLKKYSKFLLAIMLLPLFREEKWRDRAVCMFLVGIAVLLTASYLRSLGWLQYGATGMVGVFKPSIEFNFLMALGAYFSLMKIFSTGRYRLAWVIFFVLIVHTIFFRSMGRSGYFVFIALMGLFFTQKFKWRGVLLVAIGGVLLVSSAFIFSPTFKGRMQAVFTEAATYDDKTTTSVGLRIDFLRNGLKLIKANPVLGTGTGSYKKEYTAINVNPSVIPHNPHNEYIHIGVQFGVLGLLLLFGFFAIPVWYGQSLPEKEKYISRGIVVSIMVGSLANSWLLDVIEGNAYAYFIVLAFAALPLLKSKQK